ncbi:8-oxo-dGTP pyrophosphatase MutT (NUDIX family) [Thermocatellispora tengchongensis]|uniref:8-oxo-dGTP pyrophosphatase MutT (NUDIX family) n=1 Tax=Thermocatellispora tengchongensis TaxID=1073253 RepID=A0A840P7V1_9ACTN|nr:CoA pyrophosphatase [Thermocatellispora tengchongensis]MBB5133510.1 8-oxo-dGTP pyrophosphatase MutT (NUDIX family) [Thermocatellispora tengchongensis]
MIVSPIGELRERVAANLAAFARRAVPLPDGHRRAAVTVCVLEGEGGEPYTVVIRRAARGRNAGQWALPGGRVEDGEDAEAAALRELAEEVGITGVDVAGALDDFVTDSGFVITPFVAFGGRQEPRPDPREVASAHRVPLERFLAPGVPRWVRDRAGRRLLQMPLGPSIVIHAPTGAILWQFAEVALKGGDLRVGDLAQPHWTRR